MGTQSKYSIVFKPKNNKPRFVFTFPEPDETFWRRCMELCSQHEHISISHKNTIGVLEISFKKPGDSVLICELIEEIIDLNSKINLPERFYIDDPSCPYPYQIFHVWGFGTENHRPHGHMIQTHSGWRVVEYLKDIGGLTTDQQKSVLESMSIMYHYLNGNKPKTLMGHPQKGSVTIHCAHAFISLGVPTGNACGFIFHSRDSSGYTGISGNCDSAFQQIILFAGICTLWSIFEKELTP